MAKTGKKSFSIGFLPGLMPSLTNKTGGATNASSESVPGAYMPHVWARYRLKPFILEYILYFTDLLNRRTLWSPGSARIYIILKVDVAIRDTRHHHRRVDQA